MFWVHFPFTPQFSISCTFAQDEKNQLLTTCLWLQMVGIVNTIEPSDQSDP